MDKRSWPWKKKSSNKQSVPLNPATDSDNQVDKACSEHQQPVKEEKKPKYVQISVESYTHLTGLEDQVKNYEDQVQALEDEIKELNERLNEADSEITTKDALVKQHSKVAEEAVSGWEKADAEAAALKDNLESITLQKIAAEDRASHLDGALKECMKQIRNLKQEHEQKLQEVAVTKGKQFDKMKLELEGKLFNLDQELHRAVAENAAVLRSLQERSSILIQLSEEKSQAEAQIELLKSKIEACEREVNSLKYEVHIARKEAEIRNEERNMSVRSAEVANKQHLEAVKKIAKLEAECQRLRGLVRKKLPGPAALAQMKIEVENLGRDHGEYHLRRSPGRRNSTLSSQVPEFSFESSLKYIKENELLTERLMSMEEETSVLKEALAKRNSELQTARSIYSTTASKLQSLEAELKVNGERGNILKSSQSQNEGFFSKKANNLPSLPCPSEEGVEDNISSAGSWSTRSELSSVRKDKNVCSSSGNSENAKNLELMDDFLEMEKLAYSTSESNGTVSDADIPDNRTTTGIKLAGTEGSDEVVINSNSEQGDLKHQELPVENFNTVVSRLLADPHILLELQSLITTVIEPSSNDNSNGDVVENVKLLIQGMRDCLFLETEKFSGDSSSSSITIKDMIVLRDPIKTTDAKVKSAVARICEFVLVLGREAKLMPDGTPNGDRLNEHIDMVSTKYLDNDINPAEFVIDISNVFSEASKLHFTVLGSKRSESETSSSDCIDKIALPESKAVVDSTEEGYPTQGSGKVSDTCSDSDVPNDGSLVPTSKVSASVWKCSLEEFEQLKTEKDNLVADLTRCMEDFEITKSQLKDMEHLLAEVKSQLASSLKSNSLADTQLKCMAESYKSLENRSEELQTEVNCLQGRIESLENELNEVRRNHLEALDRCKDLQEQLERVGDSAAADVDENTCKEKELAAAAEKLAECQETIYLLGNQLKSLRTQPETMGSVNNTRTLRVETYAEDSTANGINAQDADAPGGSFLQFHKAGSESPLLDPSQVPLSPELLSPVGSNHAQRSSPSSSSMTTPEKYPRGFSRFFSSPSKAKLNQ